MTTPAPIRQVDHNRLRTNQAFIVGLLVLAFVLNAPWLVAFVAAVMLLGTAVPRVSLFMAVYDALLKPNKLVPADVRPDNPEPHRFAQGVGGTVLLLAVIALAAGAGAVGWTLTWLVVALASLNLFAGVCVGCLMYYGLHRLGVPGFVHAPLKG